MVAQPETPIVNAGSLYINGFIIAATGTVVTVGRGAARDSTNTNDLIVSSTVNLINLATNGANGLDTGALVANRFYAVFVIGDSTRYKPNAFLASLDPVNPVLPIGYDMFRRVGWARTDGSAVLSRITEYGDGLTRFYYYEVPLTILTAGNATTFSAGFIDLTTSSFVPPLQLLSAEADPIININLSYTPNSAANVAEFALFNSPLAPMVRFGTGVAAVQVGNVNVPTFLTSVASIRYRVSSASDALTLTIVGFQDLLSYG